MCIINYRNLIFEVESWSKIESRKRFQHLRDFSFVDTFILSDSIGFVNDFYKNVFNIFGDLFLKKMVDNECNWC